MTDLQSDTPLSKQQKAILITGIVLVILIPVVLSRLMLLFHLQPLPLLIWSRFIFWTEAGLLFLYAFKAERQPLALWNDEHEPIEFYIKWVVLLYLLSIASGLVSTIPMLFGWHDNMAVMNQWLKVITSHYWLPLFCAVTAGITEELIFRAYLVPRLQLLFKNTYLPVIVSAIMFSALHYRYFSLREIIFTFLIGVIFAVHYQKYKNIHVLIIVHFLIDFLAFMLARYAEIHHIQRPGLLLF